MGFRSTFVTEDMPLIWPGWFVEKWHGAVHFDLWEDGKAHNVISSKFEAKCYDRWSELPTDIQRVLQEYGADELTDEIVLVFLHECGGVTRYQITPKAIKTTEPGWWKTTEGVTHDYCYGCSDAEKAEK